MERRYRVIQMTVCPSDAWFWGDVDSSVESFFFHRGLSAARHANSGFLVAPEEPFVFILCIDDEDGFKFVRKDGLLCETVLDAGEVKTYDQKASESVITTTGIYMEQYQFFCTEITANQKQKGNLCNSESGEPFKLEHRAPSRS